jgi:short subunit dehydrogenase-like uncharacterized protein
MKKTDFLLYGSYGYTGRLIAVEALERGLTPLLAGRDASKLGDHARELALDHRVVSLEDTTALEAALHEVPLVIHAAGPFSRTAGPMALACLRTRTHYLDITGEVEVFEALATLDSHARSAGVMLLPGAGFDVVPSDCLAAHLHRRLPTATELTLAFTTVRGGISRGTATTIVENLDAGGVVRRDGKLIPVPPAWRTREVDFGSGPKLVTTIPWGDVCTAYHSTGIPNIEVYTRVSPTGRRLMIASRYLGWALGSAPVEALLKRVIRSRPPGPTEEERRDGASLLWGEATDATGRRAVSRIRGPEGYTLTALASVAIATRVLAGEAPAGFQTPSRAYGADFVLEIPGVAREDVEAAAGGG